MSDQKMIRIAQAAKELGVTTNIIIETLSKKNFTVEGPNAKLTDEQYKLLLREFQADKNIREEAAGLSFGKSHDVVIHSDNKTAQPESTDEDDYIASADELKKQIEKPQEPTKTTSKEAEESMTGKKLEGLKIKGKIDLDAFKKPSSSNKKPQTPAPAPKPQTPSAEPKKVVEPVAKKAEEPKVAPVVEKKPIPVVDKKVELPAPPPVEEEKPIVVAPEEVVEEHHDDLVAEEEDVFEDEEVEEVESEFEDDTDEEVEEDEDEDIEEEEVESEVEAEEEDKNLDEKSQRPDLIEAKGEKLRGLTVLGKIELPGKVKPKLTKPVASSDDKKDKKKRKRKRLSRPADDIIVAGVEPIKAIKKEKEKEALIAPSKVKQKLVTKKEKTKEREEVNQKEVAAHFKKTLSKLGTKSAGKKSYKKDRKREAEGEGEAEDLRTLKVTEFISAQELATLMDVSVNEVIQSCLAMGLFVSINQRLDADNITIIADEFGFNVEFISAEDEINVLLEEKEDAPEDLQPRAPIVTIMGHVDHGKTSLLDFIRKSKVAEGEAGGITQHIGAYDVKTESGKRITFLDTPGHEAFTAMRARGAKITDVAIIVVAADDNVMPQTIEAINHAQVAGVPIVIAINKIDKPGANVQKIKEELAKINILVEDWGGKYQSNEISAKKGVGIEALLDSVLLQAEILDLKANPNKPAHGAVIEASLDKGRGYVSTILVQAGTLNVGDIILAGSHFGRVKAMFDHRGQRLKTAGPSTPVQVLGLNGAPQAGDKLNVMATEKEAREIASKREQIQREQSIRATKRTTLSDIGKRIAMGNFQQLNIIIKGDVDGSVEALTDSLLKLSNEEVEVRIIHKAVGGITESDILLASATEGIVIGFQVRPTSVARRLAEKENVEIRTYSIIYDAIDDVKKAIEGMLSPDVEEVIVGNIEIRDVFKITKVGTVAGCFVTEGYIKRNSMIRIIRDGIVVFGGGDHAGEVLALKRFKDDVSEVRQGFECGISIKNFNDMKTGDIIEVFEKKETKRLFGSVAK